MKCYYVDMLDNHERRFYSSKREADKARRKWEKERDYECNVEEIHWRMTRPGIIDLLNKMAVNGDEPL